jgi:hypothetical protein
MRLLRNSNNQQKAISSEENLPQNSSEPQEQNHASAEAQELGGPASTDAQSL